MIALWDLGNVVVQWNPDRILEIAGLPAEKSAALKEQIFSARCWLDLDQGLTTEAQVAAQVAGLGVLTIDEVHRTFEAVRESLVDFPESVALIGEMKDAGISQYVLSNMSLVNADYLRTRAYFDLFDGVVISAEEKLLKPDTALFQVVLDRYNLQAEKVVFMDDTLPNIKAAESLGMHGVHFKASDDCYAQVRKYFSQ